MEKNNPFKPIFKNLKKGPKLKDKDAWLTKESLLRNYSKKKLKEFDI